MITQIPTTVLVSVAIVLCQIAAAQPEEKRCLVDHQQLNPQGGWVIRVEDDLVIRCQAAFRESAIFTVKQRDSHTLLKDQMLKPGSSVEFKGPSHSYHLVLYSLVYRGLVKGLVLPHGRRYAGIISLHKIIPTGQVDEPMRSASGQTESGIAARDSNAPDTSLDVSGASHSERDGIEAAGTAPRTPAYSYTSVGSGAVPKKESLHPCVALLVGLLLLLVTIIVVLRYANQRGKQVIFALSAGLSVSMIIHSLNMIGQIEFDLWRISGSGFIVFIVILIYFFIGKESVLDGKRTEASRSETGGKGAIQGEKDHISD